MLLPSNARRRSIIFFFFNDTATTEIYTLSLHDALPIYALEKEADLAQDLAPGQVAVAVVDDLEAVEVEEDEDRFLDRKSTRLNSSHVEISYAVFCLKKKKKKLENAIKKNTETTTFV